MHRPARKTPATPDSGDYPVAQSPADPTRASARPADDPFLVAPRDADGTSIPAPAFRCQPLHLRAVEVVFDSKRFPFETKSDVMRYCLAAGLRDLESRGGVEISSILRQAEHMTEMAKDDEYRNVIRKALDTLAGRVAERLEDGNEDDANQMLRRAAEMIEGLEESAMKEKFREDFGRRFGAMIEKWGEAGRVV